jgi:hypothetical protein
MRYRLEVDAVVEGESYSDALRRVGEHFSVWAADTPSDDPDTWGADASLSAPTFEVGSVIHLIPEPDSD